MTSTNLHPLTEVEVTQADRDAAAAFEEWKQGCANPWSTAIRRGEADDFELVQAFARHRLSTSAKPLEPTKLRADVFDVLRRHDVSEQCFAEVAMITHAAVVSAQPSTETAKLGLLEDQIVCAFSDGAILQLDIHEDDHRLAQLCDEVRSEVVCPILSTLRQSPPLPSGDEVGAVAQMLQDHMEQYHGLILTASECDAFAVRLAALLRMDDARREERERCAKIAIDTAQSLTADGQDGEIWIAHKIAEAILSNITKDQSDG